MPLAACRNSILGLAEVPPNPPAVEAAKPFSYQTLTSELIEERLRVHHCWREYMEFEESRELVREVEEAVVGKIGGAMRRLEKQLEVCTCPCSICLYDDAHCDGVLCRETRKAGGQ